MTAVLPYETTPAVPLAWRDVLRVEWTVARTRLVLAPMTSIVVPAPASTNDAFEQFEQTLREHVDAGWTR